MEKSVSLDIEELSLYTMKVCSTLLTMGYVQGINPDDMVEFFATQVQAMLMVPPNYKQFGQTPPVWVMRGFYPGTSVFFKLVIARNEKGTWVKASVPMAKIGYKVGSTRVVKLSSKELSENISNKMENAFFNAAHVIKELVPASICKMPRCMSPKGVKIFNYDKPKKW